MTPDATPIPMNSNVITLESHETYCISGKEGEVDAGPCDGSQLYFGDTPNKAKEIFRLNSDGSIWLKPDLTFDELVTLIEHLKRNSKP